MPGTARYLREKHPNTQTWLDFNPDGSFVFNAIPVGWFSENGNATKMEFGRWEVNSHNGRVRLMLSDDGGPSLYHNLHIKGQKAQYIIERWNEFPMEFLH